MHTHTPTQTPLPTHTQVREYYGQFVSKQAQSVIDDILAKRSMAGGIPGIAGMPGIYICVYIYIHIYMYVYIYT